MACYYLSFSQQDTGTVTLSMKGTVPIIAWLIIKAPRNAVSVAAGPMVGSTTRDGTHWFHGGLRNEAVSAVTVAV